MTGVSGRMGLTNDEKHEIVEARCHQLSAERYGHELTLMVLLAQTPDGETLAAIVESERALSVLDKALAALYGEAERLESTGSDGLGVLRNLYSTSDAVTVEDVPGS